MTRRVLIQTRVLANARCGDIVTAAELGFSSEDKLDAFIAAGLGTEIHVDEPAAVTDDPAEDPPADATITLDEWVSTAATADDGTSNDQPS